MPRTRSAADHIGPAHLKMMCIKDDFHYEPPWEFQLDPVPAPPTQLTPTPTYELRDPWTSYRLRVNKVPIKP